MFGLIAPSRRMGQRAGPPPVFPLGLIANGERASFLDRTVAASMWQATNGTSQSSTGTVVKRHDDQTGQGYHAIEATNPPILRADGVAALGAYTLTIDFGTPLGTDCTIFRAIPGYGEEILTGQTIGSTYTITYPYVYYGIVNRRMTTDEQIAAVPFLRAKAGVTDIMWYVIVDGQSIPLGTNTNSTGDHGDVVDATNHDARAKMLALSGTGVASPHGPRAWEDQNPGNDNQCIVTSKVTGITALTEQINDVVGKRYGETQCTGFAAQFFKGDTTSSDQLLQVCTGRGGTGYRELGTGAGLEPGFQHFENALICQELADSFAVLPRRILCIQNGHGQFEQSSGRSRANYTADLIDWVTRHNDHLRRNYHRLAQAPMLIDQPCNGQPANGFNIAAAVLDAYIASPTLVVCTGPAYSEPHSVADGIHKPKLSNRIQGEKNGRIERRLWRPQSGDTPWTGPTYATSAVRTGATIVVTVHVSDGILVLDTTLVAAATNYGLIYSDDTSSATISSVAITGDKQITVTLNTTPTGTNPRLRFGCLQTNTQDTGPLLGMRTNFRNSIGEVGQLTGTMLYDWMCIYDLAVT